MEHVYRLGIGVLNWQRHERQSDRYGYVHLTATPDTDDYLPLTHYQGTGTLRAFVLETRQSRHIGDIARGIGPCTPARGEVLTLGHGTLAYEKEGTSVGLLPDDGRETDWLDPHMLYRCHEQTVELLFIPDKD